jgi:hypothetical protein
MKVSDRNRDAWQAIKLNSLSEKELAEKLLSVMKREWLHEVFVDGNEGITSYRNRVQVYEQFNWIVWAVSYFYFEKPFGANTFGLPPHDNDAWIEGFLWKGIYFRLVPMEHMSLIQQEVEALKRITLEIEE